MCLMFGENYILIWIKFLNVLLTLFRQGYRERGQEGAPAPNHNGENLFPRKIGKHIFTCEEHLRL